MRLCSAATLLLLFSCRSTTTGPAEVAGKFILAPTVQDHRELAQRATRFLEEVQSGKLIAGERKFDFTTHSLKQVLEEIKKGKPVQVNVYRPWWPWSKAVAYYDEFGINLNTYTLERPDCQVVNTLVHEWIHSLGYGHGSNYSDGKDNSVPYFLGNLAEEHCLKGNI